MAEYAFLPRDSLQQLVDTLQSAGYRCIGPRARDGAIVYDELRHVNQLPQGLQDRQEPGSYRLEPVESRRCFAWANGPAALKPLNFLPREPLWKVARSTRRGLAFEEMPGESEPVAVLGVRACDLAALAIHDQHFLHGQYKDPYYAGRRNRLFLIAVNCTHPAATCFCASTGDGPRATYGYDIVLSELDAGFLVQAHSEEGARTLASLPVGSASEDQIAEAEQSIREAARRQTRRLPGRNLRDALFANLEHPRWEEVAGRCLSCGNCTSVCPTCFCFSARTEAALDGEQAVQYREWDSCFTQGHSYIHGVTIRADTRARYRQWLTHKLGSWHEQYGRSGCVGCGRCITWCPVGIDITEEAEAICGAAAHA